MKNWIQTALFIALVTLPCVAQQPALPRFQAHLGGVLVNAPGVPRSELSTNNYQLELQMKGGDKTARYRLAFNGGQITAELVDKLASAANEEPRLISFSAQLNEFGDGGGEVSIHLGRSVPFKVATRVTVQGASIPVEKEVIQLKSIGLTTRVALLPGKAVTIFDDEDEKITLKLTSLSAEASEK